ncbi:MAG: hypothetical protein LKF99_01820 [Bifidobacterium sp.]|nr:hypothetical protein [Bifidobacterium sp.]
MHIIDFGSASDSDAHPVNDIHATAIDTRQAQSNPQIDDEFIRKIKEYLIWPESRHYVYARSYIFDMLHDLQVRKLCSGSFIDEVSGFLAPSIGDREREASRHALQASSIDETMPAIQRKTGRLWSTFADRLEIDTDFLSGAFGTACLLSRSSTMDLASRNQATAYVDKCNKAVNRLLECNGLGISFTDGILGVIVVEAIIGDSAMEHKVVQYAEALFGRVANAPADRLTKELLPLRLAHCSGYIRQSVSLSMWPADKIGTATSMGWGFGSGLLLQHVLARHFE